MIFLAEAVLFLRLLWCVWVVLGWTLPRCRPALRTLHITSLSMPSLSIWFLGHRPPSPWLKLGLKLVQASNLHADLFWCGFWTR